MQAVEYMQLPILFVAVGLVAATCGFIGALVARRRRRRTRAVFAMGVLCGLAAGRLRRRGSPGVRRMLTLAVSNLRPVSPAQRHRRVPPARGVTPRERVHHR